MSSTTLTSSCPHHIKAEEDRAATPKGKTKDLVKKKLMKTVKFDLSHLNNDKYEHEGVVQSMKPEEFTMDYYHREGLEKVLVFNCEPDEIGMKIPPKWFTPRNVMEKVGENRMVQFINVATQVSFSTSFVAFVKYFETPAKDRIATYNVISLEVSGTEMEDFVAPPSLVRQIDIASYWPDERKQRKATFSKKENEPTLFSFDNKYPRVENYCLMSASASYTGFHIDFHGSSVWYHVLSGEKIFFLIEPSDENIRKYEEYLLDENNELFFGALVEKCTRVVVKAGQTLLLPSGWIHAVFTPVDSLVFGGNFIHPRSLKMQMKIVEHEEKLKLQKQQKFPQADEVFLHYMDHVVEKVTGRKHIRPSPRNRQQEGLMYVGEKYIQENRHHIVPNQKDFDRRCRKSLLSEKVEESKLYEESQKILEKYKDVNVEEIDLDEFFVEEDSRVFYHPESFGVDDLLKDCNPCGFPLPFRLNNVKPGINLEALEQLIHPSEIAQWDSLLAALLNKKVVNLPVGLTRPNSLVNSFFNLLILRRNMEIMKQRSNMPYFKVPPRSVHLAQQWSKKEESKESWMVERKAALRIKEEQEKEAKRIKEEQEKEAKRIKEEQDKEKAANRIKEEENEENSIVQKKASKRIKEELHEENSMAQKKAVEEPTPKRKKKLQPIQASPNSAETPPTRYRYCPFTAKAVAAAELAAKEAAASATAAAAAAAAALPAVTLSGAPRRSAARAATAAIIAAAAATDAAEEAESSDDEQYAPERDPERQAVAVTRWYPASAARFKTKTYVSPPAPAAAPWTPARPAATAAHRIPAAATGATPDNRSYTKDETDVIIRVCMGLLLKQYDQGTGSGVDRWEADATVSAIQQFMPYRSKNGIKNKIHALKQRPDIRKIIDDCQEGALRGVK